MIEICVIHIDNIDNVECLLTLLTYRQLEKDFQVVQVSVAFVKSAIQDGVIGVRKRGTEFRKMAFDLDFSCRLTQNLIFHIQMLFYHLRILTHSPTHVPNSLLKYIKS